MFFPLAIIIVGVIMLLENLGVITGNVWEWIWPSLIIILGLSMMFKPWKKRRMSDSVNQSAAPESETPSQNEKIEEGEFEEKK